MIDTQLLNDALTTVAFVVGLVVVIAAWVVTASALHQRQARTTQIRAIEQHLAEVAEQSPAPAR
jgi:L-cystine uptake protein TcyP (sodium:dicarboxylate symporter family)